MKTFLIVFLAAAVMALGGLYLRQAHQHRTRAAQEQAVQAELAAKASALEQAETERKRAQENQQQLMALSDQLAAELKARQAAASNGTPAAPAGAPGGSPKTNAKGGDFGKLLSGMMEDPTIKKMIREQQRGMVGLMYDALLPKLNLTPEQTAQLKDMLVDNMVKAAERAGSLFGSSTNRAEAFQQIAADQKAFEDQVRGFLGEDRYAQYRDYQETVGERMQLSTFQQQLGAANPLTDTQTEQLLTFMKEEKQAAMTAAGLPTGEGQEEAGFRAMMSEEDSNKLLQSQEHANQRVYERAAAILSAEQLKSFGQFQTNQAGMMRMGMEMTRRFMGSGGQ